MTNVKITEHSQPQRYEIRQHRHSPAVNKGDTRQFPRCILYICPTNMSYKSLQACIADLEKHGRLVRIKEEVDPYLQMAAIHLRVFEHGGPAILFENVKGSRFPAVSNLFGTLDRSKFIFRDTLDKIKTLVDLKSDPIKAIKH